MTRALLQQALEALDNSVDLVYEEYTEAVQRYANMPTRKAKLDGLAVLAKAHDAARYALRAELAKPEAQQKSKPEPEFPANWATMLHYPDCWDTAAYPELRDAIHEALAWSGCTVCNDKAQQERKPMNEYDISELMRSGAYMDGPTEFIRAVEAFHDIKETP